MIENIQLYFGTSESTRQLSFSPTKMNIIVGPNNSGKSLLLRELEGLIKSGAGTKRVILSALTATSVSGEEAKNLLLSRRSNHSNQGIGEVHVTTVELPGNGVTQISFDLEEFVRKIISHEISALHQLMQLFTIRLDGQGRLALTNRLPSHDLKRTPQNHLMALMQDDATRGYLQTITSDAFGLYFLVDPTEMKFVGIRMSAQPPPSLEIEKSLSKESVSFYTQAIDINELSDGVKAFVGLASALLSSQFKVMLIDEPEAFLHPPLARKLGKRLTEIAANRNANVCTATHSSDFLMGCVQTGVPVNVLRLTYQSEKATARLLSADELQRMMRDPLLRSTGLLSALFHQGAVVCEGDIDRALYEEVNARLLDAGEGMNDVLFTNAVGKQTIHKIVTPLRKMGIPVAAVVDLDILKEADLAALLRSANVPEALVASWSNLKKELLNEFTKLGIDSKKGGIKALPPASKQVAENLIANAAEYGVFIVPVGEIELWLQYLGVTGSKTKWLSSIFEKMGTDKASSDYVHPKAGDVWDFIRSISKWIGDQNRKGIPE